MRPARSFHDNSVFDFGMAIWDPGDSHREYTQYSGSYLVSPLRTSLRELGRRHQARTGRRGGQ